MDLSGKYLKDIGLVRDGGCETIGSLRPVGLRYRPFRTRLRGAISKCPGDVDEGQHVPCLDEVHGLELD